VPAAPIRLIWRRAVRGSNRSLTTDQNPETSTAPNAA
jgi:hypothetical protein